MTLIQSERMPHQPQFDVHGTQGILALDPQRHNGLGPQEVLALLSSQTLVSVTETDLEILDVGASADFPGRGGTNWTVTRRR